MPQRNSLQTSTGLLFVLLSWLSVLVVGEVGPDFSNCLNFFYNRTPPRGIDAAGYQPICQRYKSQYRFATLYHRTNRTPFFSAYILRPADGRRPQPIWMYEPQLASLHASPEMTSFNTAFDRNVAESQAVREDFTNSGFTKGHLNPSMHQRTKEDREATFTLTNIVPQQDGSNSGPWNLLEKEVLRKYESDCKGPMYMITGVMPYMSTEAYRINNRVSVPEYIWSAYCCPSYTPDPLQSEQQFFPTYAAVGRNDRNSGEEIVPVNRGLRSARQGYDVREMSLETLESILAQRMGMQISLFNGNCKA